MSTFWAAIPLWHLRTRIEKRKTKRRPWKLRSSCHSSHPQTHQQSEMALIKNRCFPNQKGVTFALQIYLTMCLLRFLIFQLVSGSVIVFVHCFPTVLVCFRIYVGKLHVSLDLVLGWPKTPKKQFKRRWKDIYIVSTKRRTKINPLFFRIKVPNFPELIKWYDSRCSVSHTFFRITRDVNQVSSWLQYKLLGFRLVITTSMWALVTVYCTTSQQILDVISRTKSPERFFVGTTLLVCFCWSIFSQPVGFWILIMTPCGFVDVHFGVYICNCI